MKYLFSGNGLVSYYIDLVLEGVGIKDTETKSIVNGCLQVHFSSYLSASERLTKSIGLLKIFNFLIAMAAAMLVDTAGRRLLFLISNIGMLASTSRHSWLQRNCANKSISILCMDYYDGFVSKKWRLFLCQSDNSPYIYILLLL